jgi:hypothetical protein
LLSPCGLERCVAESGIGVARVGLGGQIHTLEAFPAYEAGQDCQQIGFGARAGHAAALAIELAGMYEEFDARLPARRTLIAPLLHVANLPVRKTEKRARQGRLEVDVRSTVRFPGLVSEGEGFEPSSDGTARNGLAVVAGVLPLLGRVVEHGLARVRSFSIARTRMAVLTVPIWPF